MESGKEEERKVADREVRKEKGQEGENISLIKIRQPNVAWHYNDCQSRQNLENPFNFMDFLLELLG